MSRWLFALLLLVAAPVAAQTPLHWTPEAAKSLVAAIGEAGAEGLDPADYHAGRVTAAIEAGDAARLDIAATDAAFALAGDYRYGRVAAADRVDWHLGDRADTLAIASILAPAAASGDVRPALDGLLPRTDGYRALKAALAATPKADTARRDRLRVNLERWRWMPRDLGDRYVFVNVPAYRVVLRDGERVVTRDAIVGKPGTPTPAFASVVEAAIVNPTWAVPPMLKADKLREIAQHRAQQEKLGFSVERRPGGQYTIWQKPGPSNALGQVKIVMPNPYDIYLHDTPQRKLFAANARTLSHGCIRVKDPVGFAAELLDGSEWDRAALDEAVATRHTTRADLAAPMPVYVAYFTAEADGGDVKLLPDPYARDAGVIAALSGRMQVASAN